MKQPLLLRLRGVFQPETVGYLESREPISPVAFLLALGLLYQHLTQPNSASNLIVLALAASLLLALFRAPRGLVYIALLAGLLVHIHFYTQILALSPARAGSTRDRAAIATARALMRGVNPWNHTPEIPVPATTGPASILLVLPSVWLFGKIAGLTYLFWTAAFGFMAVCDVRRRNQTFPVLALLFMTGIFGIAHNMEWRLEELCFPYGFLVLAYYCIRRKHPFLAGVLLAIPPLSRISYVFIVAGFLFWYLSYQPPVVRDLFKIAAGAALGGGVILTPFLIVGGSDFLAHNFYTITHVMGDLGNWQSTSAIFQFLNRLTAGVGPGWLRLLKPALTLFLLAAVSFGIRKRRIDHPFWHLSIAALLAHTVAWHNALSLDYALIFILPAFLAVALSRPRDLVAAGK